MLSTSVNLNQKMFWFMLILRLSKPWQPSCSLLYSRIFWSEDTCIYFTKESEIITIHINYGLEIVIMHVNALTGHRIYDIESMSQIIFRLNSGNKNPQNFFLGAIFLFKKKGTDSVNHADSGDIKVLVSFPGNSILKFFTIF